ncbi:hypothetical protein GFM44_33320 [Rhizobium leguminosarum bv. viciae]|jgi:hypothetical protein|nr:hypothetical protein [Rhizobium leguminosarum bv. viciae]
MPKSKRRQKLTGIEAFVAVKECLIHILTVQTRLRSLNQDYKWSNLFGDYGEMLAIKKYGLDPAPVNTVNHDARTPTNETVQIKTCRSTKSIGFRGDADLLLVSKLQETGNIEQIYYGPFCCVKAASRRSERDNKYIIEITKLKQLAVQVEQRPEPINPIG